MITVTRIARTTTIAKTTTLIIRTTTKTIHKNIVGFLITITNNNIKKTKKH